VGQVQEKNNHNRECAHSFEVFFGARKAVHEALEPRKDVFVDLSHDHVVLELFVVQLVSHFVKFIRTYLVGVCMRVGILHFY